MSDSANSLLPPSVKDERFLQMEAVINRLAALDLGVMAIYDIDNVDASALYDLAAQFDVLGLKGWNLAGTEAQRRELIKQAIALHKTAGTAYSIRLAMTSVGYPNATVTENPPLQLDGSWALDGFYSLEGKKLGCFFVTLDPQQTAVSQPVVELIIALINQWKNVRSHLIDLRIGDVSLFRNLLLLNGLWQLDGAQELDGERNL